MLKRYLPFLLVFSLLFVLVGCGSSNETSKQSDKPDNYIEDLDISKTIQKGINQRMDLVGHFENPDMTNEEKIQYAQETEQTILPEIQTLLYDLQNGDPGDQYLNTSNAYGSLQNMCKDTIKYFQDDDENAKTEFYDQSQRALEELQKAKSE